MSRSANVQSVQTLKDFKNAMITFAEDARNALSGVDMDLRRMRDLLERDQLGYWQAQVKRRKEELMQARADLHRRKISQQGSDASLRHRAEGGPARGDAAAPGRRGEGGADQAADPAAPPRDRRVPLALAAAGRPPHRRVRASLDRVERMVIVAGSLHRHHGPVGAAVRPAAYDRRRRHHDRRRHQLGERTDRPAARSGRRPNRPTARPARLSISAATARQPDRRPRPASRRHVTRGGRHECASPDGSSTP